MEYNITKIEDATIEFIDGLKVEDIVKIENIDLFSEQKNRLILGVISSKASLVFGEEKIFIKKRNCDKYVWTDIKYGNIIQRNFQAKNETNENIVEEEFNNYLLPIGSVVELLSGERHIIIGRAMMNNFGQGDCFTHYTGDNFDTGYLEAEKVVFNHDQIKQLIYPGFQNVETWKVTEEIKEWIDKNESLLWNEEGE